MQTIQTVFNRFFPRESFQGKWLRDPRILFFFASSLFFVLMWVGVSRKNEFVYMVPLGMIFAIVALQDLRHLWMFSVIFLPFSMELQELIGMASITFPTDVTALALVGLITLKLASERGYDLPQYKHPIFVFMLIYLGWIFASSISSSIPVVSYKWFAATTWMVIAFWFVTSLIFYRLKYMYLFVTLVGVGFAIVVSFIFIKYGIQGRNIFGLRINPTPFFKDHTVFGTFPTLFIPFLSLFTFMREFPVKFRRLSAVLLGFMILGLLFSYSRGAWASSFASTALLFLFLNRGILKKYLTLILVAGAFFIAMILPDFLESVDNNKSVSRKSLGQHIASITNFKTDASNSERLNRWNCAIEMYRDRPVFGYGPGTYAFTYGRFQGMKDRTFESTNHGNIGTAHSEVLLALSEQGWPGAVLAFLLFLLPMALGIRGYFLAKQFQIKVLYLGATFGLFAYFLHSFVNNFLDQDKIGMPFYVFMAMITALDVYHRNKNRQEDRKTVI